MNVLDLDVYVDARRSPTYRRSSQPACNRQPARRV